MFRYFKELYLEIKIWRRIKKIAKESEKTLNDNNFRVDWVGRIYTVINLPEDMMERTDLHEGYVFLQLKEYDKVFMEMGIGDYLFPEVSNVGPGAYLLVLTGPKDYLSWWDLTKNILKWVGLLVAIRILYSVVVNHSEKISNLWQSLKDLL